MSNLKVNSITNFAGDGPTEFSNGIELPAGQSINGTINANVGFCTASAFFGSGSGITGLVGIPKSTAISLPFIVGNV